MKDSKKKSITEALCNVLIGYPIAHVSNLLILIPIAPHLADVAKKGVLSWEAQLMIFYIGVFYTMVSLARQYFFRRIFNKLGPQADGYTLMVAAYNRIKWGFIK